MRNTLFIAIFSWFAVACSKSDAPSISYTSSYAKSGLAPTGKFRMFAKAGEITDAQLLARHEESDTLYLSKYPPVLAVNPSYFLDTIRFVDQQTASVRLYDKSIKYAVTAGGGYYTLASSDTLFGATDQDQMSRSIAYAIPRDRISIFGEGIQSVSQGFYTFFYYYLDRFIITGAQGGADLTVPMVFYLTTTATSHGSYHPGYVHGRLSPDFYKSLNEGDTLSLMEYNFLYRK